MNTIKVFSEWLQWRLDSLDARSCEDEKDQMRQPRFEAGLTRLATEYADRHFDPSGRNPEGPEGGPYARWVAVRDLPFDEKKKFWQLCFESHVCWLYEQYGLEPPVFTPEPALVLPKEK